MAENDSSVILLAVVTVVAILGLGLALASFATNESVTQMMNGSGGGPMGSGTTTTSPPGGLEWGVLIVSAIFLAAAVVLLVRTRSERTRTPAPSGAAAVPAPAATAAPAPAPVVPSAGSVPTTSSVPAAVPEPTLVKLLNEDERRMYLELRDHGGTMYQRDLVALGIFSKAKVTRVLDKLEAKGLIVREAHGMTNRVRLVNPPAK